MGAAILGRFIRDVVDELGEDEGVVLEKVSREKVEGEAIHFFADDGAVIGFDSVGVGTDEEGDSFFEGRSAGLGIFANGWESFVNGLHRDGALRDVDEATASALREKSNGTGVAVLWLIKVRGELGAVVPLTG